MQVIDPGYKLVQIIIHINYGINNIRIGEWIDEFNKDHYNNHWKTEREIASSKIHAWLLNVFGVNCFFLLFWRILFPLSSQKRDKERDLLRLLLHDKETAGMRRERTKVSRYETTFSRVQRWKRQRIPNSDRLTGRQ
ncbi:hypothetical protein V1478_013533 [Vespula squamosa]|uniref:Uncharacterized protein n=1 Tax=Vespula squamosa TaxID=30214 RepID=A0ABD2A5S1_VESSQ